MKALKKTSTALIAFAVSASAYAGSDLETRVVELEKKMEMISTTTSTGVYGVKTASARAEPNGYGWNVNLDVLYWQTKLGGSSYGVVNNSWGYSASPISYKETVQIPRFKWDFGVKFGIGYNFDYDKWDTKLEYTYFRNQAQDHVRQLALPSAIFSNLLYEAQPLYYTSEQAFAESGAVDIYALEAKGYVDNKFDDLYLDLGRDFFVSKSLSMRPAIGVEATWFNLRATAKFLGGGNIIDTPNYNVEFIGNTYSVTAAASTVTTSGVGGNYYRFQNERHFYGIGPRAGVDTRWHLGEGFCIYGGVKGALLFSYIKNHLEGEYSGQKNNDVKIVNNYHSLNPAVKFDLGIMYDKYCMNDTQHFAVALGYENQYYWRASFYDTGLGMYGVNLKFQWDF